MVQRFFLLKPAAVEDLLESGIIPGKRCSCARGDRYRLTKLRREVAQNRQKRPITIHKYGGIQS
jgi:hypothetical protein